ncbi:MAG: type IV pili twitching motility protein PilT [Alphaproteobacteria bacterium CG_4_10_14_0_2_um_filter_63_37]|nr:MAG: type IV pili twitching motility protein PilT [Proteobacteria bacterium CG1_02_64_396]PJA26092.1 MAG: type IV pili twitching motility protein PilT [Alphaproteobacteria bacterium CG_4_10_14_0_2_um_filter_63_37]
MTIRDLLKIMVAQGASDIYITVGAPPTFRINGVATPMGKTPLAPPHTEQLANSVLNDRQKAEFSEKLEMNLALSISDMGRFRVNILRQQGHVAMVIRRINTTILTTEELELPAILNKIVTAKMGLVLMVGATGSGKSTSMAAMVDFRNRNVAGHILTIEDPIEFVHVHKRSIVTQREIGMDTHSFHNALVNALRQAPDCILIGEIRDAEFMEQALTLAETGHLTMATLHANNAYHALDRVVNLFPEAKRHQVLQGLSLNLVAVVSQRLIPGAQGGRAAAVEVMINTPRISELIIDGKLGEIRDTMAKSRDAGCQTFDQHLYDLFKLGKITEETAIKHADSLNDIKLMIKADQFSGDPKKDLANISKNFKL